MWIYLSKQLLFWRVRMLFESNFSSMYRICKICFLMEILLNLLINFQYYFQAVRVFKQILVNWNWTFFIFSIYFPLWHYFNYISELIVHLYTWIVYCATRKKKFILQVWSLMPEQSKGNNHTSKINVFPVSNTIFFY